MNNNLAALLWFVALLAAIPIVLWLLRRSPMLGGAGPAGTPRAVAMLPISPSQRVVTVEVGQGEERVWLVLGVTAQSIRTLHTMAPLAGPQADAAPPPAAAFANLLHRLRDGGRGNHAR